MDREGRGEATPSEWAEACARYEAAAATQASSEVDGVSVFAAPLPDFEALEMEFKPTEPPRKPAHRIPDGIPTDTMRSVKALLEQRRASPRKLTQQAIADEVGLSRPQVQRCEALHREGWDLLRSTPDFWAFGANDDMVYLPNLAKARQILGLRRSD